jgi:hypothetical protein
MRLRSRVLLSFAATISVLALLPLTAGAASGHDDDEGDLLRSGLVGSSTPANGGVTLFDTVNPGGKNWVVDEGSVRVDRNGRLEVRIEGLVIPDAPFNGTNPVATVSATLVCNGVPGTPTSPSPLSVPAGNGRIRAMVTVPTPCLAPAVLVNPNGAATTYIASNG